MKSKRAALTGVTILLIALTCRMPSNIHAGATAKHGAGRAKHDQATGPADKHGGAILRGEDAVAALHQRGIFETIRADIEATRYKINRTEPGAEAVYQAANPAQNLRAYFNEQEASMVVAASADLPVRASLRLSSIGYGDALQAPGEPQLAVCGNRIEYCRANLTEWYVNGPSGLEHGFVLENPPGEPIGDDKVVLTLTLSGDLQPRMDDGGRSVLFQDNRGQVILRYSNLEVRDASGRQLGASLALRDGAVAIYVDDRAALYPITIDPLISSETQLLASDGAKGFGFSVSLDGDTVVVGAPFDDSPAGRGIGSAYVFVRTGATWSQQAHLFASDPQGNEQAGNFGLKVSVDGNTVLVGAPHDNTSAGSAYVFVRSGTTWSQQAHLFASDGGALDRFGLSVSVDGDTVLVGAPYDSTPAGTEAGSAYVFVRSGTTWSQQAHLFATDGAAGDIFGKSIAVNGDTAVIGAPRDNTPAGTKAGSVYVFVRSGTTWSEQVHLFASDGAANQLFGGDNFYPGGNAVAVSGDTIVVGAPAEPGQLVTVPGSAYVFFRIGTIWSEQAHLVASDGANADVFGWSVAVDGETLAVGAPFDDNLAGRDVGSAYVFVRSGSSWSEQAHLFASDGGDSDFFGHSVSVDHDTVVVGAWGHDTSASGQQGSAYVYELNHLPIAMCQNVTKSADANCRAAVTAAEVDNGSSDPDGDPITLSLSPAGPYPLGTTIVTLTVADSRSGTDSCQATVTVIDTQAPIVTCSVNQAILSKPWPPNHNLVNVGFSATATDNCNGASLPVTVRVFGDENDEEATGDGSFSPDAANMASGTLRLRQERKANADGRVYLIIATAADSSGNVGVNCCTVVVPLTLGTKDIASANAQAAAAKSYCLTHSGAQPPGYFVVGDGPIAGPKQ